MNINYDNLAREYKNYRIPDPRIAAAIARHIPSGARVLNIGAGLGAYEPVDCQVTAIEPSMEMIARRATSKSVAIQGCAEDIPFADDSFDVSMAILTIHHWQNLQKGLDEMMRVTKGKSVIFTWNGIYDDFWLLDYFPEVGEIDSALFPSIDYLVNQMGGASVEVIEIPNDCTDGFMCAYWRRPKMYLDPMARQAISTFSRLGDMEDGLSRLQNDLHSGTWQQKYGHLLSRDILDCGYRLVIHDKSA